MARSSRRPGAAPLPAGVPAGAAFVNETHLTNAMVKEACRLTVSPVLRVVYFLCGIGLGVFALVWRLCFSADTMAFVLVLLLGLMTVWQGSRLPLESARRMISQLDRGGEGARDRVFFATDDGLGVVVAGGEARTFPWAAFNRAVATTSVCCLTMTGQSVLFVLAMDGFTRGTNAEFVHFVATHVTEPPRGAVARACERVCRTLDDWGSVQQAQRERDAAKRQARQERREARRDRRR